MSLNAILLLMSYSRIILSVLLISIVTIGVQPVEAQVVQPTVPITKLNVPYYKQQYANSCESAALRMALAYYGIKKNDVQVLTQFGYNPHHRDWVKNIWDDPQKQYVGHVDITGKPYGGYGVYGLPVVRAAENFKRRAEYSTSTAITAPYLAKQIEAGYPVVLWGYTSITEPAYTWNTPEGKEVKAFKGEHARTLVGLRGTSENPVGFYVHDPFNNRRYEYWKAEDLISHMNAVPGVTDQAVVIK